MYGSRAAIRYAKAVLLEAGDAAKAKAVYTDMEIVKSTLAASKELRNVLKSPIYKNEDKKAALLQIFSDQTQSVRDLVNILAANQRTEILGAVADSYMELYNESQGIKVATVTTAVPLTSELKAQVLAKVESLTGTQTITLVQEVDEAIIGGFILRLGDLQYNASISNQFGNLKKEFNKSL
jgi:F-type H+-transporting ATPase subunit delta